MPAHKKVVSWRGGSAPQTITFFLKLCSFIYSPNTISAVSRSNKVRTKLGRESNQTISWSGSLPRLQWANSCAQTITRTRYESNSIRARMQRHLLYFTEDDTTDHNFWDNLQLCNLDCNKQIQNGWSPSRKARQSRAGVSSACRATRRDAANWPQTRGATRKYPRVAFVPVSRRHQNTRWWRGP